MILQSHHRQNFRHTKKMSIKDSKFNISAVNNRS